MYIDSIRLAGQDGIVRDIDDRLGLRLDHNTASFEVGKCATVNQDICIECNHPGRACSVSGITFAGNALHLNSCSMKNCHTWHFSVRFLEDAIERNGTAVKLQDSTLQKDHSVHLVRLVHEELEHALLTSMILEQHLSLETPWVRVFVWALQEHSEVVDGASVALANINDNAWVFFLLEGDLAISVLGFKDKSRFSDDQLLFVQVR